MTFIIRPAVNEDISIGTNSILLNILFSYSRVDSTRPQRCRSLTVLTHNEVIYKCINVLKNRNKRYDNAEVTIRVTIEKKRSEESSRRSKSSMLNEISCFVPRHGTKLNNIKLIDVGRSFIHVVLFLSLM